MTDDAEREAKVRKLMKTAGEYEIAPTHDVYQKIYLDLCFFRRLLDEARSETALYLTQKYNAVAIIRTLNQEKEHLRAELNRAHAEIARTFGAASVDASRIEALEAEKVRLLRIVKTLREPEPVQLVELPTEPLPNIHPPKGVGRQVDPLDRPVGR